MIPRKPCGKSQKLQTGRSTVSGVETESSPQGNGTNFKSSFPRRWQRGALVKLENSLSLSLSLSLIFALARWLCELRIRRRVETWQTRWSSVPTYGDEAFGPGQSALVGTYVRIGRERIMGRKIGNVIGILFKSDRPTIARNISYIICLPSSTFKYACPFADPTIISSIL